MLARKLAEYERQCIEDALAYHRGSVADAAHLLKIGRRTLYRKMIRLGIEAASFRPCANSVNRSANRSGDIPEIADSSPN